MTDVADAQLLARVLDGDESAWHALVDRHGQLVYASARAAGADTVLAEDVAQLVWMRLLDSAGSIQHPDRLRGWLAIVARNTARGELRRRRPEVDLDEVATAIPSTDPRPDEQAERREDRARVRNALARLGDSCRELLTLLFSAEMSYAEIAAATGRPIGSIGPTRQRCLATMRRLLGDVAGTTYDEASPSRLRAGGNNDT
jgi:RNA polymerase sigma factor (sigma-70 family)